MRFWEEAQHLGIQWTDESLLTVYVTPLRDELLAAILDAAQTAASRPIPVLAQSTTSGAEPPALKLPEHSLSG